MPQTHLHPIDWVLIASYFLTLVAIGLYYRRFAVRSLEDFFLGGRRNTGWSSGVSYAAAMMNADVAPAYSGVAVATGLFVSWFYLSRFSIPLFLGALLFAVFWRRLNLFTTPEFYELRFGGLASSVIRTWVAVRSSLIAMVAWTGTGLLAMYKIAEPVVGLDKTQTMLIVIPIVLLYVGMSGFAGVVAAASVQSLIMVIGSAMLCGIVLYALGGPAAMALRLEQVAGPQVLEAIPPMDHEVFPLMAAMAWMIGLSIGYGGDTAPLGGAMEGQYLLSSRNTREASKMYVVAEVTLFILLLLVTLPALGALVHWPELRTGGMDREMAYGLLMARYLPPGMLGLLFVVMLAAVMSTVSSNLIFGSQLLVNDVYRRHLGRGRSDRHYVWVGRVAALLILGLALTVAYNVELIFHVAAFMVAASAAELPANWAQWWWWRFNRWGRLAASFGGIAIPVLVWFYLPTSAWPWWERTFLAIGANTALWILVTLLTPPDSPEVLERFYRRARPLGAWGPLRRRLAGWRDGEMERWRDGKRGSEEAEHGLSGSPSSPHSRSGFGLIAKGLGLALLGSGSVMLLVQGLSHLYVGQVGWASLELGVMLVAGVAFFRWYGPYLDRLELWTGGDQPVQVGTAGQERQRPREGEGEPVPEEAALPLETELGELPGGRSAPATVMVAAAPGRKDQPASPGTIVALATLVYGLLIAMLALLFTSGEQLAFNLLAAGAFLASAALVWRLSRPEAADDGRQQGSEGG